MTTEEFEYVPTETAYGEKAEDPRFSGMVLHVIKMGVEFSQGIYYMPIITIDDGTVISGGDIMPTLSKAVQTLKDRAFFLHHFLPPLKMSQVPENPVEWRDDKGIMPHMEMFIFSPTEYGDRIPLEITNGTAMKAGWYAGTDQGANVYGYAANAEEAKRKAEEYARRLWGSVR